MKSRQKLVAKSYLVAGIMFVSKAKVGEDAGRDQRAPQVECGSEPGLEPEFVLAVAVADAVCTKWCPQTQERKLLVGTLIAIMDQLGRIAPLCVRGTPQA